MAWLIEFSASAEKQLDELDPQISKRILKVLYERIAILDDPRSIGEALRGPKLGVFWKYRVGDYRIISRIEDEALKILVVKMGNCRDVYR